MSRAETPVAGAEESVNSTRSPSESETVLVQFTGPLPWASFHTSVTSSNPEFASGPIVAHDDLPPVAAVGEAVQLVAGVVRAIDEFHVLRDRFIPVAELSLSWANVAPSWVYHVSDWAGRGTALASAFPNPSGGGRRTSGGGGTETVRGEAPTAAAGPTVEGRSPTAAGIDDPRTKAASRSARTPPVRTSGRRAESMGRSIRTEFNAGRG